jgi:CBS domain-containing protein
MSPNVEVANPDDTIQSAAMKMTEIDAGILPVGENDRLVGMVTDRDIAVRAVAQGRDPKSTKVREVMSGEVKYCFDDEDVTEVAKNMADLQVRRLPVLNREKRLVGIISVGDLAADDEPSKAGDALQGIAQPGGPHTQAQPALAGDKPSAG